MATASPARRCARFDQFEVDLAAAELRKSGQRIALQDQPFQILRLLVEAAPEIVTRNRMDEHWPSDTFVDFDLAINTAVDAGNSFIEEQIGPVIFRFDLEDAWLPRHLRVSCRPSPRR